MNEVAKWAAALCTAAVGCTALQMLAPKGGLGKLFKLITAAFFLLCLVSPLLSMKNLTSLSLDSLPSEVSGEVLQERVQAQFEQQVNAALLETANNALKNYDIQAAKMSVSMDTGEDGGIYITKITLYLDKQNASQAIAAKQVMEQRLGTEIKVEILPD